jgi:hypothetical protein
MAESKKGLGTQFKEFIGDFGAAASNHEPMDEEGTVGRTLVRKPARR